VSGSNVTPLQKVLQMMDDMLAKGKDEIQKEKTEFASFQQWCDSTKESTTKAIAEGADQIEQLTADIAKAEADAEELAAGAKEQLETADADQAELDGLQAIRDKEHKTYSATHADLSESLDAIDRALAALKARAADVPQSLLELRSSHSIPAATKSSIESLLALAGAQAPEANAYEFQGGTVVKMLEDLRHKFQDQRLALEKAEMAAKANFEVLKQKLSTSVKVAKETAAAKTAKKAERLEDAATAKGDLSITKTTKAEDEKTLDETNAECKTRSEEFAANQVVRAEEIKAIETAKGILQSDDVSGSADKHLPSALAQTDSTSFAQLRGDGIEGNRQKAIELLQNRAKELGSRYLSLAASRVAADPFAKVKKMVKDLIVKLMEEANAEADHNAYCTTELSTNKLTRQNKQSEVEELTANVEKHTSQSAQLKSQLADLSDAVAELKKKQAEATEMRQEEKTTNTATIEEAKVAQVAVSKAVQVLKDFYAKQGASLLQGPAEEMGVRLGLKEDTSGAVTAGATYKGMGAGSGGILGMLEVVLSDFARLETETTTGEAQAQDSYDKFMDESNQDAAVKETEIAHKNKAKEDTDANNRSLKKELELTQEELDAAMDYYDKLKPDCLDSGLSYEERVEKREQEIQALKEALQVLAQESV